MSSPTAFRIAVGVWAFSFALTVAAAVFFALSYRTGVPGTEPTTDVFFFSATAVVFSAVGTLVASRRPRNAIGWLLLAIGLVGALTAFSSGYAMYGLIAHPGALPATTAVIALGLPGSFVSVHARGDVPAPAVPGRAPALQPVAPRRLALAE